MAKRYGRNQRRHHRQEIEALRADLRHAQAQLALHITGGFAPATGHKQQLDDVIGTIVSVEVHDFEDQFTVRREATIKFIPADRKDAKSLVYMSCYSGAVEWRGIVWQIMMPHLIEYSAAFYDVEVMEIELRALGSREHYRLPNEIIRHRNTFYSQTHSFHPLQQRLTQ